MAEALRYGFVVLVTRGIASAAAPLPRWRLPISARPLYGGSLLVCAVTTVVMWSTWGRALLVWRLD